MKNPFRFGTQRGKDDIFLSLMVVAREDAAIRATLLAILRQDNFQRQSMLNTWIADLKIGGAPGPFIQALGYLLDDATAQRARELLENDT